MIKALLQKAKTALEPKRQATHPVAETPKYQQHLDLIVVPKSAMDAYPEDANPLVEALVNYVNFLTQQAQFNRFEIPAEAIQAFHADYYLAQVNNGGHAQFVGNSGANLAYTLSDVTAALAAMGATSHLSLAEKMAEWTAKNPDEAEAQTGFEGGIAPELAALDGPFYELEKSSPIRGYLAAWIADLEVLQVVDDAMMPRVLQGIKSLNPNLNARQSKSRIAKLVNQLSNPLFLGLGIAGASAQEIEPLLQIGNGSYRDVDGESQMTWFVQTTKGKRFGVSNDAAVELRELVDTNERPISNDLSNVTSEDIRSYKPISVGKLINSVPLAQVDVARNICESLNAPIAIELLLSKLPDDTTADFASIRSTGKSPDGKLGASICVVCNRGRAAYSVIVEESGSRIVSEPAQDVLAEITPEDISDFLADLEAN